jgi:hypothetical protein
MERFMRHGLLPHEAGEDAVRQLHTPLGRLPRFQHRPAHVTNLRGRYTPCPRTVNGRAERERRTHDARLLDAAAFSRKRPMPQGIRTVWPQR